MNNCRKKPGKKEVEKLRLPKKCQQSFLRVKKGEKGGPAKSFLRSETG